MCEQDLAAALAASLDQHFERLVLAYQHRVYGFALRLTGNAQDAEEIAQDAFVRAYRAMSAYPAERVRALRLRAWLYQITLNVFRNRVRARLPATLSLEQATEDAPAIDVADDPQTEPPALAEGAEERRALARMLMALPAHFRAAVVLRHVEGYTYGEMAEMLGEPVGTVKSHTHRGTLLLREMLARRESEVRA